GPLPAEVRELDVLLVERALVVEEVERARVGPNRRAVLLAFEDERLDRARQERIEVALVVVALDQVVDREQDAVRGELREVLDVHVADDVGRGAGRHRREHLLRELLGRGGLDRHGRAAVLWAELGLGVGLEVLDQRGLGDPERAHRRAGRRLLRRGRGGRRARRRWRRGGLRGLGRLRRLGRFGRDRRRCRRFGRHRGGRGGRRRGWWCRAAAGLQ